MESPSFKTHNQYDRFRNRRNRFVLSVTVFLLCALAGFYYFSPDDLEKEKAPGPISVWSDPATGEPLGWLNEDGTFSLQLTSTHKKHLLKAAPFLHPRKL